MKKSIEKYNSWPNNPICGRLVDIIKLMPPHFPTQFFSLKADIRTWQLINNWKTLHVALSYSYKKKSPKARGKNKLAYIFENVQGDQRELRFLVLLVIIKTTKYLCCWSSLGLYIWVEIHEPPAFGNQQSWKAALSTALWLHLFHYIH